jgi:hypothetical protein
VHLVLDSFNRLENYDGLISYGKSLLRSGRLADTSLVQEVAQIVRSAESKVVSTMTMAALDNWESARQELMQVADQGNKGEMGEQALNALIVSSRDKKDLPTLFYAIEKLAESYPQSSSIRESLGIGIDTALKIGQFRLLTDYLERFAGRFPKDDQAADLMLQAARMREGLGQYAAANRNYRQFLSMGKASQQQLDDVVFAMVENARLLGNADSSMEILNSYAGRLSPSRKLRANAELAVLNYQADRRSQGNRYSDVVKKDFQPQMAEKDSELRDTVAELHYYEVFLSSGPYFKLRLKKQIDNKVVTSKSQLLQKLEDGYQKVMAYKSPDWALKACFRASELNREFADFLTASPLPDGLSQDQIQQYKQLVAQKARAYQDKADQYVKTCVQLAHKWEICDPRLAAYFVPADNPQGREGGFASFADRKPSSEISQQALKDQGILPIYHKMMSDAKDATALTALAKAYLKQGDYNQACLVAQNGLSKLKSSQPAAMADLYNVIGLAYLNSGQDRKAKEAFQKALENNALLDAARVNLAGLYHHYGHHEKARELISGMVSGQFNQEDVYPRSGALKNEYSMQTE